MRRAVCMIRDALVYRRAAFVSGLRNAGFEVIPSIRNPDADDVLVIWNRYGSNDKLAETYAREGAKVIVVENGYLGKSWLNDRWFAMAIGQHAGGGDWIVGGPERWDDLNVIPTPWRQSGKETLILAQRGIGSPSVRSPENWANNIQRKIGGRVRPHPGKNPPKISLDADLANASCVVTWASTAALTALLSGVPVWYEYSKWIGAGAARHLSEWKTAEPNRDDEQRLTMFRRLVWAMWRISEIESGAAFKHLLGLA